MIVYTFREDDDNLYVKNVDENNKPIGGEMAISWKEWDLLIDKKRLMKNVWSFELSKELQDKVNRDKERIDWLMVPERLTVILMATANKNAVPDMSLMFRLGGITEDYSIRFPEDSRWDCARYIREVEGFTRNTLFKDSDKETK